MRKQERDILEKAQAILKEQYEILKIRAEYSGGDTRYSCLADDCKDAEGAIYNYLYSYDYLKAIGLVR